MNFSYIYVKTTKTSQRLSDYCDVPSSSAAAAELPRLHSSCSSSSSSSVSRMSSLTWKVLRSCGLIARRTVRLSTSQLLGSSLPYPYVLGLCASCNGLRDVNSFYYSLKPVVDFTHDFSALLSSYYARVSIVPSSTIWSVIFQSCIFSAADERTALRSSDLVNKKLNCHRERPRDAPYR